MLMRVSTSPLRMKCSVNVAWSLIGTPLRRCHPFFRCVVVTVSFSPSHVPVEKPIHVWGAYGDGCARPSR